MKTMVEEVIFQSSNGIDKIHGKIIKPIDIEPKGIVQISHGMCEYFDKYMFFAEYLVNQGYIVCGHDHLGHGDSVSSKDERGYFAKREGYKFLIEDLKNFTDIVSRRFSDLPLFLFGHSMGSLIARCYAAKYGDILNGLIVCGTVGPQPLAIAGIKLAKFISDTKGDHYRSKKLYNLALDFASIKFLPTNTRYDWLCSDDVEVSRRVSDEKSDFIFTASAFQDLFRLTNICNSDIVIKTIPKSLPILFISGSLDPIGENGNGVKRAVKLYKDTGLENVTCKLYPDDRHELINEKNKLDVYADITAWLNGVELQDCEEI